MMTANARAESLDSATMRDDVLLKRALLWSVGLHLAVLAAFTVRAVFYPSDPLIAEKAIRVDLVGLPDKVATLPPLEALDPAPAPPAPPAPKQAEAAKPTKPVDMPKPIAQDPGPKVNLNKTKPEDRKREQEAALKRLEAMQKLESMMKSSAPAAPQPAAATTSTTKTSGGLIKGNEISRGSSLRGTQRLDHENYVNAVDEHVHRHWNLPQWMANANFKARVLVFVDAQGNVVKKQLTQSSGNQVFDERVMLAIERSSPFPVPPSNLVDILAVDGIEFGFPE